MLGLLSFDLISPDGYIHSIDRLDSTKIRVVLLIDNIASSFKGFEIDKNLIVFNLKSTLAQLGIESKIVEIDLKPGKADLLLELFSLNDTGKKMLFFLEKGAYIGKLFAQDPRRLVKDPDYLTRMFSRFDEDLRPLLCFGAGSEKNKFLLEKIENHTVAHIPTLPITVEFSSSIDGLLFTLGQLLKIKDSPTRTLLKIHQVDSSKSKLLETEDFVLLKTLPLHIRTAFAQIEKTLLPKGIKHTSADILQPDTFASGDIYEFYGKSNQPIDTIPLRFYTLEPYKEHVFFIDRDQLKPALEKKENLFKAFETAPPSDHTATFVVKGSQLESLSSKDWVQTKPVKHRLPGEHDPEYQDILIDQYIKHLPSYPFLDMMENGSITSQGVLLTRYFPSPLLKQLLLSQKIKFYLKRIYFEMPSKDFGDFFSHEDRSMLFDLEKFNISTYWVDKKTNEILQFVIKRDKDTGMFVPLYAVSAFRKATIFGVYGSNLYEGTFENELTLLLDGINSLKKTTNHPLLNKDTPLALVTGGGPGAMEVGNRAAKNAGIISCANIVDFHSSLEVVHEQKQNPYIEAKMTYRLEKLVERQAEFHLDFPIFLIGGFGMDFEYALEQVIRKVGAAPPHPILLFGSPDYWKSKITSKFQCNRRTGTIKGSEWISNCFYCIEQAKEGLAIYEDFFQGQLKIGHDGPIYEEGFCSSYLKTRK